MAAPTGIMDLLAKPKGKGGSEKSGPPDSSGDYDSGGEVASALRDMFDALKGGRDEEAATAFKRAKVACEDEDADDDMSDMDMGDEDDHSDEE